MRTLWGSRVVIWITMILVLFPVVWIVMSSFSAGDSFFLSSLFPDKFSVEHYVTLFQETDFTIWVFNSLKFCFIVAVIQLILTSLAAYAFARLRFVGRKYGLMSLLVLQVFPNSMAVAGYYILIYKFGLVDSSIALIFVLAGGSAYNIWLLKSYIDGLPVELDEAAMVDGANEFQIFWSIMLPLVRSMVVCIAIMTFMNCWNDFYNPLLYISNSNLFPLAYAIRTFSTQYANQNNLIMAASLIVTLPSLVLFFLAQKQIIGSTATVGLKG